METFYQNNRQDGRTYIETPRINQFVNIKHSKNFSGRQRFKYVRQIMEDVGCNIYVDIKRLAQNRRNKRIA